MKHFVFWMAIGLVLVGCGQDPSRELLEPPNVRMSVGEAHNAILDAFYARFDGTGFNEAYVQAVLEVLGNEYDTDLEEIRALVQETGRRWEAITGYRPGTRLKPGMPELGRLWDLEVWQDQMVQKGRENQDAEHCFEFLRAVQSGTDPAVAASRLPDTKLSRLCLDVFDHSSRYWQLTGPFDWIKERVKRSTMVIAADTAGAIGGHLLGGSIGSIVASGLVSIATNELLPGW